MIYLSPQKHGADIYCAWAVGDLGERAYLQDEVVSRVPYHRKGMCVRILGLQLSLSIHCLGYHLLYTRNQNYTYI